MTESTSEWSSDQKKVHSIWPEWNLIDRIDAGRGQYGRVYKARKSDFSGDSYAAIKIIPIQCERLS